MLSPLRSMSGAGGSGSGAARKRPDLSKQATPAFSVDLAPTRHTSMSVPIELLSCHARNGKWISQPLASGGTDPAANTSAQRVPHDEESVRAHEYAAAIQHERKEIQSAQRSKQTLKRQPWQPRPKHMPNKFSIWERKIMKRKKAEKLLYLKGRRPNWS